NNVVLAPLRAKNAPNITLLISVTGVSYIIQNGLMLVFGSSKMAFPKIFDYGNLTIGGVTITSTQISILVVSLLLFFVLFLITKCTKMGLAMRCSSQNPRAANLVGINVRSVITFTFFLSGMCAAVAGFMIAGYYEMVYFTMGTTAGLKAFSAAVLGGIGVLYGSVAGGLIVGIAEAMATTFFGSNYAEAAAYIILFLVLLLKPSGLFGKDNLEKV
ncbi:MAG: branched-chain amino acid ABC transporter permease, partial [Oscillospiraceae bacterium]